ncbi:YgfZ/GcvT domain-containing protein [Zhongshania sp.]|jgi:folate-binding protein YgfZ|uniref:CAF17-like 4Fe-4S cluster assembly/insertion protein YgfZ n=1 Tax=Zhongshania sp. TaxID=1971902 RepID=UPI0039E68962
MNTFWEFLSAQYPNSTISTGNYWHAHSSSNQVISDCNITVLSQYGFLAVEGPDSIKFLQGQTTCDWRKIDTEHAALGSYCNIKGRMVMSFIAGMQTSDAVLLRLHADTGDSACATLAKYIVFSKAKIRNATEEYLAIGISGKNARSKLIQHIGMAPTASMTQVTDGKIVLVQLDDIGERFECWTPAASAVELWTKLSACAAVIDSTHWEALNIAAGLGEICTSTQDTFIPQMLNYQVIGGVSFNKGCYTGQEVVARMQYRGKLKRRLYRAKILRSETIFEHLPGADLFNGDGPQSIGNLVSAVSRDKETELLAVLTEDAVSANNIHFANESATMEILDLPYTITSAK